ncbi:MotA/TolQ/ExbB proton channel family protein [Schlesneria paludicola]|uniref:MotA/TolQ/ExbB proton channel family protein n=1 Tax=Schlesneria paludicola TaxID=360056 RepID=UPI00029A26A5|nr:MotA/TolQ/ExbB proton channel family protein [Schlesneria paludicola]
MLQLTPEMSTALLNRLSSLSTPVIVGTAVFHLLVFFWLMAWARRDLRRMALDFDQFTRELKYRSILDRGSNLSDQIDAFLADIKDVLDDPAKSAERHNLWLRMRILDEERRYLQSHAFETWYTICRTMIEAYPLAGVLGTVLAIGAALQSGQGNAQQTLSDIVRNFGESIWSTFAGLFSAMILMFVNSIVETKFRRLTENRLHVRETVARAKRELSIAAGGNG